MCIGTERAQTHLLFYSTLFCSILSPQRKQLTTMSDPAFDVSLTAEGERSMGEGDGGVRGVSSGPLRATTNSTSPRAFCRMLMACWWEMLESSGWPSIARIWSPSRSLPSLQQKHQCSMNTMSDIIDWTKQFQMSKKMWQCMSI